jgi:hypothetical protein
MRSSVLLAVRRRYVYSIFPKYADKEKDMINNQMQIPSITAVFAQHLRMKTASWNKGSICVIGTCVPAL